MIRSTNRPAHGNVAMDDEAFEFLLAIGDCHRQLQRHAIELRKHQGVRTVEHVSDMPELPAGFRLAEYVDAELMDGEALSWCLEITVTVDNVAVEADVRRIHALGQDVIYEIAESSYSSQTACSLALPEITKRLCSANPL